MRIAAPWTWRVTGSEPSDARSTPRRGLVASSMLVPIAVSLACGGLAPAPSVDPAEVDAVARAMSDGAFPAEVTDDPDAWPVLLTLADRHPDPRVVAAALYGLADADPPPDGLAAVVERRLGHPDGIVLAAALAHASRQMDEPAVRERVTALVVGHEEPGGRHAALVALCRHRGWPADPQLAAVVVGAASDPAPPVVAEALQRLAWAAEDLSTPDDALRTALARFDHPLPAVRANAGAVAIRVAPDDGWAIASARALLDDPHVHVRAAIALALAELGDPAVLPDLLALSVQRNPTTWELGGWTRLDGSPGELRFIVSRFGRTDDAALEGLAALTAPLGDDAWTRPAVDPARIDRSLRDAADDAATWYAAHADAVARLERR